MSKVDASVRQNFLELTLSSGTPVAYRVYGELPLPPGFSQTSQLFTHWSDWTELAKFTRKGLFRSINCTLFMFNITGIKSSLFKRGFIMHVRMVSQPGVISVQDYWISLEGLEINSYCIQYSPLKINMVIPLINDPWAEA